MGDKCHSSHAPIIAEQKKNLKLPSRSSTPAPANKAAKKKQGKGEGAASGANPPRVHCRFFLRGKRKHGAERPFAHPPKEAVDEIDRSKNFKAKPKARARRKEASSERSE